MGRNAKIKAQRRTMLAPGQPASNIPLSVRRSTLTGKWLTLLHLPGAGPAVISPHYKRSDAVEACGHIRAALSKYTVGEIVSGERFNEFLASLTYDDDDEILAAPSPEAAIEATQRLRAMGEMSDAAYVKSMAKWTAKKGSSQD